MQYCRIELHACLRHKVWLVLLANGA
jgi:hypothetical protein